MTVGHVNYDQIATVYHQRYAVNRLEGVAAALKSVVESVGAERVLETGCGTGRWLAELRDVVPEIYGLDAAPGMLEQVCLQHVQANLVCGRASQLPFRDDTFDFVFCVNALHHFDQPHVFVSEARRLLRPGGALAVITMDPHAGRDHWYLYDYFDGTCTADLRRFPSSGTIVDWMVAAGFEHVDWRVAEHIRRSFVGREVLADYFLQKHSTSQLVLLTDEAYTAGMRRIEAALAKAETNGKTVIFPVDISLTILTGRRYEAQVIGLSMRHR
jgi:ubiquinone/menaquinone biosynthesis C-methylase UbiE